MPAWALRLLAVAMSAASMLGSTSYVLANPKNPSAPLQPPVPEKEAAIEPDPYPSPAPLPFRTLAPTPVPTKTTPPPTVRAATARPTTAPTPVPTLRPTPPPLVLGPGVRATTLPRVTVTHSS